MTKMDRNKFFIFANSVLRQMMMAVTFAPEDAKLLSYASSAIVNLFRFMIIYLSCLSNNCAV